MPDATRLLQGDAEEKVAEWNEGVTAEWRRHQGTLSNPRHGILTSAAFNTVDVQGGWYHLGREPLQAEFLT